MTLASFLAESYISTKRPSVSSSPPLRMGYTVVAAKETHLVLSITAIAIANVVERLIVGKQFKPSGVVGHLKISISFH